METSGRFNTLHNLPKRQHLIGRERYIEQVRHALLRRRSWIVSIDGIGGVGKSALALEIAHQLKEEGIYVGIVWVSAKASDLTPSGIELRTPGLRSEDDLIRQIMRVAPIDDTADRADDRRAKVFWLLSDQASPYLIIIDNLDTVEDERVFQFLYDLGEREIGETKAIITSRKASGAGMEVIKLEGLEEEEAVQLLLHEANRKSLHSLLDAPDTVLTQIAHRCTGLPLAIIWVIARMHAIGASLADTLKSLEDIRGGVLEYVFRSVLQSVSPDAREILNAVPAFATTIPKLAIEEITLMGSKRVERGIEELCRFYLLSSDEPAFRGIEKAKRYAVLPATRMLVESIWDQTPGMDMKYLNGATDYYLKSWQRFRVSHGAEHLDDDYQNLRYLLDKCFTNYQWSRVVDLATSIEPYLRRRGLLDDRAAICTIGIRAAQYGLNGMSAIRFKESIAKVHKQRGEYQEAFDVFRESLSFYRDIGQKTQVAQTMMQLGIILEQQAEYTLEEISSEMRLSRLQEALVRYQESSDMFAELGDPSHEAQTLHLLGRVYLHLNMVDEAEKTLQSSIRLKQVLGDPVRIAITQPELAWLRDIQGRTQEAIELCEEAIATLTFHAATKDAANAKWRLSKILNHQPDRLRDAYQLNLEAVEAYRIQGRWVKYELASRDLRKLEAMINVLDSASIPGLTVNDQERDEVATKENEVIGRDALEIPLKDRLLEIRKILIEDPIEGAEKLSAYLAIRDVEVQNQVDLFRSELVRIQIDKERYGSVDPSLASQWQRSVFHLLDICRQLLRADVQGESNA